MCYARFLTNSRGKENGRVARHHFLQGLMLFYWLSGETSLLARRFVKEYLTKEEVCSGTGTGDGNAFRQLISRLIENHLQQCTNNIFDRLIMIMQESVAKEGGLYLPRQKSEEQSNLVQLFESDN
ncbi:hypothetical protein RDI58_019942 [Solanum bulbocastanum]|uniref:Uncharacterized protein n=1 Tax=Solanum bulbocastanum TaxID=147425 RepID=A0AAN8TB53_SOLBU